MGKIGTFLRWVALVSSLLLVVAAPEFAMAADPFAILFGEELSTTGPSDTRSAHEDNIQLVGVRLRDYPLIDVASAYAVETGLCLEAQLVFDALKLPLRIENDRLSGWVKSDDRTVDMDLESATGTLSGVMETWVPGHAMKTPQGWCLSLSVLTDMTKIDFDYRPSTLMVVATPRETLPIEAKLERARLRESALAEANISVPLYPVFKTPYQWLSAPTADVVLDMDTRRESGLIPTVSIEAAADFLKTTARFRSVDDGANGRQFRLNLGRTSEQADQLGFLKARHFSAGHISTPAQPLTARSATGLGAIISNNPTYRPNLFDQTEIFGPLPLGWEAELYQDDRLIAFTDSPDPNGNYRFKDVPLLLGYNRLTVKLFGPYGEVDQRVVTRFVGGAQCPDGEWRYTVALIRPDAVRKGDKTSNFGGFEDGVLGDEALDDQATGRQRRLLATIEHGLNKRLSARVDGLIDLDTGEYRNTLSLFGSFSRIYGGVRMATDGTGMPAFETFAQTRLSDATSLSLKLTDFGDLDSDYTGQGPGRLARQGRLRLETRLGRRFGHLPLRNTVIWNQRDNGETSLSATTVSSANYRGVNWSHSLAYTASNTAKGLEGGLIASKTIRGARVRVGLNYAVDNGPVLKTVSISGQRDVGKGTLLQASSSYDMEAKALGAQTVLTKAFPQFMASARAGVSQNGDWHAGLNLAFSLHKPKRGVNYRVAQPGLSRTGGVRLLSYIDSNGDGLFGSDEQAVSGVKYIVDNSLRSETSRADGVNLISGIDPYRMTQLELQMSSVEDPFLKPTQSGRSLSVRPGQVVTVHMPLLPTGDVDGTVQLLRDGYKTPLAGVTVEVVDQNGNVLSAVQTEYDGYFYADGIPIGEISMRIADADLQLMNASAVASERLLTTETPSATDVMLIIRTD